MKEVILDYKYEYTSEGINQSGAEKYGLHVEIINYFESSPDSFKRNRAVVQTIDEEELTFDVVKSAMNRFIVSDKYEKIKDYNMITKKLQETTTYYSKLKSKGLDEIYYELKED